MTTRTFRTLFCALVAFACEGYCPPSVRAQDNSSSYYDSYDDGDLFDYGYDYELYEYDDPRYDYEELYDYGVYDYGDLYTDDLYDYQDYGYDYERNDDLYDDDYVGYDWYGDFEEPHTNWFGGYDDAGEEGAFDW